MEGGRGGGKGGGQGGGQAGGQAGEGLCSVHFEAFLCKSRQRAGPSTAGLQLPRFHRMGGGWRQKILHGDQTLLGRKPRRILSTPFLRRHARGRSPPHPP